MSKRNASWINGQLALLGVVLLGVGAYWGVLLRASLSAQYGNDPQELAGFLRWLLGYGLLLLFFVLLGWLNHRGPFTWLAGREGRRSPVYYAWLLLLWWGLFELLQWRSSYEVELIIENWLGALLALLIVAGLTLVLDQIRARRERVELIQQKTAAELHNLRAQLHPHFLFNALNTLYSEALQAGNERLAEGISELSGILRFALNQAQQERVSLAEELAFLQRYAKLQLARLPEHARRAVLLDLQSDGQPAQLAPLLIMPFLENAFQYGLHPDRPCFLNFHLRAEDGKLRVQIENSVIGAARRKGNGLGIANAKQRLERLYPGQHELAITQDGQAFKVSLSLPLEPQSTTL